MVYFGHHQGVCDKRNPFFLKILAWQDIVEADVVVVPKVSRLIP